MTTITINYLCDEQNRSLTAVLTNDLSTLSNGKRNQATEIIEDFGDPDRWSLIFGDTDKDFVEVVMYRDDDRDKTTDVDYILHWSGGVIMEAYKASVDVEIR